MIEKRQRVRSMEKNTYLQVIAWFWKDALLSNYRKIRWISLLQILSVLANFGGFAILYFYVNKIEANETLYFLQFSFEPRQSQALLILTTGMVGLLFLSSGLLDYRFHQQLLNLNKTFEKYCVARLYKLIIKKTPLLPNQNREILSPYNLKKSLIKDTKFYGRALFAMVKAAIPIFKLILSLAFMFYLAFSFTLLVVLIISIGALFIWRVSKLVVKETNKKEKYIKIYVKELAQALVNPVSSKELLSQKGAQNYFDAFYSWLLKTQQNRLIIKLLIAAITTLLLLIIGHLTLFGSTSWSLLIGYLLGLRYFLNSLQGINGFLKQLSTFYDYIRNYSSILVALTELTASDAGAFTKTSSVTNDYFQFQPDDDGDDLVDDF